MPHLFLALRLVDQLASLQDEPSSAPGLKRIIALGLLEEVPTHLNRPGNEGPGEGGRGKGRGEGGRERGEGKGEGGVRETHIHM